MKKLGRFKVRGRTVDAVRTRRKATDCNDTEPPIAILHASTGPHKFVHDGDAMHVEGPHGRIASFYGMTHEAQRSEDGHLMIQRGRMTTDSASADQSIRLKAINQRNRKYWEGK